MPVIIISASGVVAAGRSGVHGHLHTWLLSEFQGSLGYVKPVQREGGRKREKEEKKKRKLKEKVFVEVHHFQLC